MTMTFTDSTLLSQAMQQRLQTRIAQHNGLVEPVATAIRQELAQLDHETATKTGAESQSFQAQRALLIAQLSYLASVEQQQQAEEQGGERGFWSWFRRGSQKPVAQ
jgi:predicted ATPase